MPVKEKPRKTAAVATPTDAHLYQQPTEELLLQLVGKEMYSKWNPFGVYLGIKQNVRDGIKQQTLGDPEACFIKLCSKWIYSTVGTGEKPRTWKTVLNAVRECEYPQVADAAEKTLVLRLTKTDVAILCIDKYNDQLVNICLAKKTRHLKKLYLLLSIPSNGLCPRSDVVLHHHIIKELKEAMKRDHENMDIFCTFLRLEFSGNTTAMKIASDMKGDFDRGTSSLKCSVTNFIEDNRDPAAADTEGCLRNQNRDEGYLASCPKNGWIVSGTFPTAIVLLSFIVAYMMKGSGLQDESVPSLPGLPTAFTGRSEEVKDILSAFLQKQIQVVAITGGPGYGKSSLAIVCAHELARKGINVHHILLNEVNTTVRFTSKVLMAFDELQGDKQQEDTLLLQIKALKQATVLVLDNADRLTLKTSTMSSFLVLLRKMTSTSSLLKMIVTTRYRFNMIEGFRQMHLHALSNNFTIDLLSSLLPTSSDSESSSATNFFHIQQIANLTGGVPLAVKVVCQLLNSEIISVDEVVKDLSTRPVHTLSHETFSPEEQLNRCFNLSYTHLSKQAKLCFVYASRFPDAFSTEAGRAIVANLSTDLECLPRLVDRSLLEYDVHTKRYSMHLLLRHFVQEQESVGKDNIRKWKFWKLYVNFYMDHFLNLSTRMSSNASYYGALYSNVDLDYEHFLRSLSLLSDRKASHDAARILIPIDHQLDIAEKTFHIIQIAFPHELLANWWSLILQYSCRKDNNASQPPCYMPTHSPMFMSFVSFARKFGQFWLHEKEDNVAALSVYEFGFKSTQGDIPIGPKISCEPMSEPEYVRLLQDLADVYKTLNKCKVAQALSDAIDRCEVNNIHTRIHSSSRIFDILPKDKWCTNGLPIVEKSRVGSEFYLAPYDFISMLDYLYLLSYCKTPVVAMQELQDLETNLLTYDGMFRRAHSKAMLSMSKIWDQLHGNVSREVYWLEKAASVLGDTPCLLSSQIKFQIHFRLARLYFTNFDNISKALYHSQAAYDLAESALIHNDSLILFFSVYRLACLLSVNGSFNSSVDYFQQAASMLPLVYSLASENRKFYYDVYREIQVHLFNLIRLHDFKWDRVPLYYQWYKRELKSSPFAYKQALDELHSACVKFSMSFMSFETALSVSDHLYSKVDLGFDPLRLIRTIKIKIRKYTSYTLAYLLFWGAYISVIVLIFSYVVMVSASTPAFCVLIFIRMGKYLYRSRAILHQYPIVSCRLYHRRYNIVLILIYSFHYFLYTAIWKGQLWLPTRLPVISKELNGICLLSILFFFVCFTYITLSHGALSYIFNKRTNGLTGQSHCFLLQEDFDHITLHL